MAAESCAGASMSDVDNLCCLGFGVGGVDSRVGDRTVWVFASLLGTCVLCGQDKRCTHNVN